MKLDSDIKRIVSNENIVTELETINKILVNESDRCKFYTLENETIGKYGLTRNSLIESVLALFLSAQPKQELKTANRIHYESKKDAEANKESDWIGVEDKMPKVKGIQSEQITFLTLGDKIIDGYSNGRKFYDADGIIHRFVTHWKYKNNDPKEEEQTFITETQTMFIVEVKMLSSDKKIYHVLNSKNKEEAVSKVREHYKLKSKFNGRCYIIDIIDYEFIN